MKKMSTAKQQTRADLTAFYRLVAGYGWDDLLRRLDRSAPDFRD